MSVKTPEWRQTSSEDRANLIHSSEICRYAHLFGQLRALGKESRSAEVIEFEDVRSTLGCTSLQLGSVYLKEAVFIQVVSKLLADR